MENEEKAEQLQFEELIQGLIDRRYGSCNDFILPSTITGLLANIELLKLARQLETAGIGNNGLYQKNEGIRGDKINWIDEFSKNQFEHIYLQKVKNLIAYLNKTCFTSINSFESHYAHYEVNTFYKRHLDQFKTENGRQFSIVLYLNENWLETDAGNLQLHPTPSESIDILPIGGRIVLFKSEDMEHEVKPSNTRERNSIAAWLKN